MEQLDLRDVTLVGHSLGCGEVVHYLSRHGARRVGRAVLIGTITPGDNPPDKSKFEKGRALLIKDPFGVIAKAAADFFGTAKNTVSDETMRWWARMMTDECNLKVMLDLLRVFTATDDTSARLEVTAKKQCRSSKVPGSTSTRTRRTDCHPLMPNG